MEQRKNDYLSHHGIRGQKWGIRRYQNEDGTLTNAGKSRYAKALIKNDKDVNNKWDAYRKGPKVGIKTGNTDPVIKATLKGQELRKSLYESSKECKSVVDKIRKKSVKFLEDDTDKTFNEMEALKKDFKKASQKMYEDLFAAYGDTSIKNATGNYKLIDVLVDAATYDDFWNYAFGDWK